MTLQGRPHLVEVGACGCATQRKRKHPGLHPFFFLDVCSKGRWSDHGWTQPVGRRRTREAVVAVRAPPLRGAVGCTRCVNSNAVVSRFHDESAPLSCFTAKL